MDELQHVVGFFRQLATDPDSRLTAILSGILLAITTLAIRRKGVSSTIRLRLPGGTDATLTVRESPPPPAPPEKDKTAKGWENLKTILIGALVASTKSAPKEPPAKATDKPLTQSGTWGADIKPVPPQASSGAAEMYSRADHVHAYAIPEPVRIAPTTLRTEPAQYIFRREIGDNAEEYTFGTCEEMLAFVRAERSPPDCCGYPPQNWSVNVDSRNGAGS